MCQAELPQRRALWLTLAAGIKPPLPTLRRSTFWMVVKSIIRLIPSARRNHLIEQSHRPTRQQERSQIGFKNPCRAQEFLVLHARVSNLQQYTRTTVPAHLRRWNQNGAHLAWQNAVEVAV